MSCRRRQRSVKLVQTCCDPSCLTVIPYMEDLCGTAQINAILSFTLLRDGLLPCNVKYVVVFPGLLVGDVLSSNVDVCHAGM